MSFLSPLLDIQKLDLEADAAKARSGTLSEREALPVVATKRVEILARLEAARSERAVRESEEEELGRQVSQIVKDLEAAEVERYSGKRKNQDEAAEHKASQEKLHAKQSDLEEQEMTLLESIEDVDDRIAKEEAAESANGVDREKLEQAIAKVEGEVVAELERLAQSRQSIGTAIPGAILSAYDTIRLQPRKGGRGAAELAEGRCGACRITLPSLERSKMMAAPEDELIQCPQCRRVLVR